MYGNYGQMDSMITTAWLMFVVWSVVTIGIGTWVGGLRGRPFAGFFLSLWLSVFGIIIVALLPDARETVRVSGGGVVGRWLDGASRDTSDGPRAPSWLRQS